MLSPNLTLKLKKMLYVYFDFISQNANTEIYYKKQPYFNFR